MKVWATKLHSAFQSILHDLKVLMEKSEEKKTSLRECNYYYAQIVILLNKIRP